MKELFKIKGITSCDIVEIGRLLLCRDDEEKDDDDDEVRESSDGDECGDF